MSTVRHSFSQIAQMFCFYKREYVANKTLRSSSAKNTASGNIEKLKNTPPLLALCGLLLCTRVCAYIKTYTTG